MALASQPRDVCADGRTVEYSPADVTTPEFAARMGRFLHDVRRERRLSLRQLSGDGLSRARLKAVERGEVLLDAGLVSELAGRYGAELEVLLPERDPVVLLATGTISAGGTDESYVPGDIESLLEAYLRLIRRLRGANADQAIVLRRDDLIDIADQLGRPRPEIVDRVAVLLGATGAQRRAMVELYLSGASVVGVAG